MDKQKLREAIDAQTDQMALLAVEAQHLASEKARVIVGQIRADMRNDLVNERLELLATRRDLLEVRLASKSKAVRANAQAEIDAIEAEEVQLLTSQGIPQERAQLIMRPEVIDSHPVKAKRVKTPEAIEDRVNAPTPSANGTPTVA